MENIDAKNIFCVGKWCEKIGFVVNVWTNFSVKKHISNSCFNKNILISFALSLWSPQLFICLHNPLLSRKTKRERKKMSRCVLHIIYICIGSTRLESLNRKMGRWFKLAKIIETTISWDHWTNQRKRMENVRINAALKVIRWKDIEKK